MVSAATVTRLRSFGDSSARVHTCPNSTSSVKSASAGAKSPNCLRAPDGSLSCVISLALSSFASSGRGEQQAGGRGGQRHYRRDQQAGAGAVQEARAVGQQRAEDGDGQRAADLPAGIEHAADR